ncbi:hypothetical protein [Xylanimonas ulmi]|uniref:hypothetical protein n=1 Tax=Xylanimonas ulmi TaxID=228973 RepID=UPI00102BE4B8|nr:hypothetical protein [Xylanibacterium ulmi]
MTHSTPRRNEPHDVPASRRDADLIPWQVKEEHRGQYPLAMLRLESRRRASLPLSALEVRRLDSWLGDLAERGVVVLYDPDTPDGFYLVPRAGRDDDVIRRPAGSR